MAEYTSHGFVYQAENIRQLPAQSRRMNSGAVKFGDDWPGVFIRGDNAMCFEAVVRAVLKFDVIAGATDVHGVNDRNTLEELVALFQSSFVKV